MSSVADQHRAAPLQKQRSVRSHLTLLVLGRERLQNTAGFVQVGAAVEQGMAQFMMKGRKATNDEQYCMAFERVRK